MKISLEYINKHATDNGGWTLHQVEALGLSWPPGKGWQQRLVGTIFTETQKRAFELGKNISASNTKKKNKSAKIAKSGKTAKAAHSMTTPVVEAKSVTTSQVYLDKHKTTKGGWTRYQFEALGLDWPLKSGWKKAIIGKVVSNIQCVEFERGKNITSKHYKQEKILFNNRMKHFVEANSAPLTKGSKPKAVITTDNTSNLEAAINLALWMVKDKGYSLKAAINSGSKKYDYPVKAHIEKGLRERLPEGFLEDRMLARSSPTVSHLGRDWIEETIRQNLHMKSILEE